MKRYIVLLLSCSFACTQAMQEPDVAKILKQVSSIPLDIVLIHKRSLLRNPQYGLPDAPSGTTLQIFETIQVGPNTTWHDVQDQLRQKVGPGKLLMGQEKVSIGEKTESNAIFVSNQEIKTNEPILKILLKMVYKGHTDNLTPEMITKELQRQTFFLKAAFDLDQDPSKPKHINPQFAKPSQRSITIETPAGMGTIDITIEYNSNDTVADVIKKFKLKSGRNENDVVRLFAEKFDPKANAVSSFSSSEKIYVMDIEK